MKPHLLESPSTKWLQLRIKRPIAGKKTSSPAEGEVILSHAFDPKLEEVVRFQAEDFN